MATSLRDQIRARGFIHGVRAWWREVVNPPTPERDRFCAETGRKINTTRVVPFDAADSRHPVSEPRPRRARFGAILALVAVLSMSGCATLLGAVDRVTETIRSIEVDFAPYIAALPPEVQAALVAEWAKVKAAIAAANAVLAPLR